MLLMRGPGFFAEHFVVAFAQLVSAHPPKPGDFCLERVVHEFPVLWALTYPFMDALLGRRSKSNSAPIPAGINQGLGHACATNGQLQVGLGSFSTLYDEQGAMVAPCRNGLMVGSSMFTIGSSMVNSSAPRRLDRNLSTSVLGSDSPGCRPTFHAFGVAIVGPESSIQLRPNCWEQSN